MWPRPADYGGVLRKRAETQESFKMIPLGRLTINTVY